MARHAEVPNSDDRVVVSLFMSALLVVGGSMGYVKRKSHASVRPPHADGEARCRRARSAPVARWHVLTERRRCSGRRAPLLLRPTLWDISSAAPAGFAHAGGAPAPFMHRSPPP